MHIPPELCKYMDGLNENNDYNELLRYLSEWLTLMELSVDLI